MRAIFGRPLFWLAVQAGVQFLIFTLREDHKTLPEWKDWDDGYVFAPLSLELSWDAFVQSLSSCRSFGYLVYLRLVRLVTPEGEFLPLSNLLVRLTAVMALYGGLRHLRFSGWLAVGICSTLLYTRLLHDWIMRIAVADPVAESFGILSVAMLFFVVGSPRSPLAWAGLTLALFCTYQIRPSYLYLIPLLPLLGLLLRRLYAPQTPWLRLGWQLGPGLAAACALPFLAFGTFRYFMVGHFGVTSFEGYAMICSAGQFATPEIVPNLPPDVQPLVEAVLHKVATEEKVAGWSPAIDGWGNLREDRLLQDGIPILNMTVYDLYWPAANEVYQLGHILREDYNAFYNPNHVEMNRKLARAARAIIWQQLHLYAQWVTRGFSIGLWLAVTQNKLLSVLLLLLALGLGAWYYLHVWRRIQGVSVAPEAQPGPMGGYRYEFTVLSLLGIGYLIPGVLQTVAATFPDSRYMEPLGIFLPGVALVALFAVAEKIRTLVLAPGVQAKIADAAAPIWTPKHKG